MQFFLFGLAALVLALFAMGGFTRANPAAMARQMRLAGGALALGISAILLVRGMAGPAALLGALGSWLLGWGAGPPSGWGGGASRAAATGRRRSSAPADGSLQVRVNRAGGSSTPAARVGLRPRAQG